MVDSEVRRACCDGRRRRRVLTPDVCQIARPRRDLILEMPCETRPAAPPPLLPPTATAATSTARRELWEQLAVAQLRPRPAARQGLPLPGRRAGLPEHERGSAATEAYLRVDRDGRELPRARARPVPRGARHVRAATRAWTTAARSFATSKRAAGSLDETLRARRRGRPVRRGARRLRRASARARAATPSRTSAAAREARAARRLGDRPGRERQLPRGARVDLPRQALRPTRSPSGSASPWTTSTRAAAAA